MVGSVFNGLSLALMSFLFREGFGLLCMQSWVVMGIFGLGIGYILLVSNVYLKFV